MPIIKCEFCDKEFHRRISAIKNGKQFCSVLCRSKYDTGKKRTHKKYGKYLICKTCKKEFYVTPHRILKAKYCSRKCWNKSNGCYNNSKVKNNCLICDKEFLVWNYRRNTQNTCSNKCFREYLSKIKIGKNRGKNNHNWKGGITPKNKLLRKGTKFKLWRKSVFERDNYTCWICEQRGFKLHPHHLKSFSKYPKLRFVVSNGLTLCEFCHKTYTKWGHNNQ